MRVRFTFFFFFAFCYLAQAQLNFTQISTVGYNTNTSDIWGYTAPNGTEYALVGLGNGLSIVSLADPVNPVEVAMIPGGQSIWRDIKTWKDFAYVTTDQAGTTDGLLIVDLTQLPDAAPFTNWNPTMPDGATLNTCHNIYIDEFGVAYLAGSNSNGGGLIFLDVDTEPGVPTITGVGSSEYSHDVYVRDNLAYSAEINIGFFSAYDVTDKTNVTLEATQSTPFNFTHNVWLSDDGLTIFTTDEVGNAPIGSYDVSDLDDIKELDQFVPATTAGEGIAPHNVHVWNDYLIISYYRNGCLLVDAARPDNLIEVGYFDSFTAPGFTFDGAWGAYPFLPSQLVLLTDQTNGLFVLEPNYVRACYLEGMVTDASNNASLFGATVNFVTEPTTEDTDLAGEYKTGIATAGTYDILVSKPGYESQTISVDLENGEVTDLTVALVPLTPFEVTGNVVDVETGTPIANAQVSISNADFDWNTLTDANGNYALSVFEGEYDFFAGIWGHKTTGFLGLVLNVNDTDLGTTELDEGYEDIFSLDLGWDIVDDAIQGNFERIFAEGYIVPGLGFPIQPANDVVDDFGNHCFVTGSSTDLMESVFIGSPGATTAIISPEFDMTNMNVPTVSIYTWMYSLFLPQGGGTPPPGDDVLVVKITNGVNTVIVLEDVTANLFDIPSFSKTEVNLDDIITPTATMQLIVEIETNEQGDITEAAVDFFRAFDADPVGINE
ncbi:MAG: choice-of-anchor B domain-containing protein, partial [Saprospiraceae bacterium]